MNLNQLTEKEIPELLRESPRKSKMDISGPVPRPHGISEEEFTEEYQQRLKDYRVRRPELYHKIITGV